MSHYPYMLVTRWTRDGVKHKEFWILTDPKTGLYLDFYTKVVYGDGEHVPYERLMAKPAAKKPTRAEQDALDTGDLGSAYRMK